MKANIKTDFEKWFIKQLVKEGTKYYLLVGAIKAYVYFEGQDYDASSAFITMQIHSKDTQRVATNVKYHPGAYKFYIYGENILIPDKITDALATLLDEITIEETGGFRIETGLLSTQHRGNKFADSTHYENIVEINFHHWSA